MDGAAAGPADDPAAMDGAEVWRREMRERGVHVLGGSLTAPGTARTVRVRDGERLITDGPFTEIEAFVASIDVVTCADRRQVIELAAAHPIAAHHTIEVRPFYSR